MSCIMVLFIMDSGPKMEKDKVKEYKYGLMEVNFVVIGKMTRHMVWGGLSMLTVTCMKENGISTKHMVEALMSIWMAPLTLVIGRMTVSMALE